MDDILWEEDWIFPGRASVHADYDRARFAFWRFCLNLQDGVFEALEGYVGYRAAIERQLARLPASMGDDPRRTSVGRRLQDSESEMITSLATQISGYSKQHGFTKQFGNHMSSRFEEWCWMQTLGMKAKRRVGNLSDREIPAGRKPGLLGEERLRVEADAFYEHEIVGLTIPQIAEHRRAERAEAVEDRQIFRDIARGRELLTLAGVLTEEIP